jgi:putative acetyltransferase
MALSLRSAVPADRHAIEALVFSVLADYGLRGDPEGTDRDLADLDGVYLKSGGTFDVLIDEAGEVVGSVGLARVSATTCELRKMYLAASVRGQGEGRRLLLHALARAKQLGFRRVELETASVLREAIALYVAHGFKPFTPAHLSPRCDCAYYLELS